MFKRYDVISVDLVNNSNSRTCVEVVEYRQVFGFKFNKKTRVCKEFIGSWTFSLYDDVFWCDEDGIIFDIELNELLNEHSILQANFEMAKVI